MVVVVAVEAVGVAVVAATTMVAAEVTYIMLSLRTRIPTQMICRTQGAMPAPQVAHIATKTKHSPGP